MVEHNPAAYLQVAAIEPDADEREEEASVARKSLISRKFATAVGHVENRYQYLDEVIPLGEEILRLIEDAMSQTTTYQYTDKDVEKQWRELLI